MLRAFTLQQTGAPSSDLGAQIREQVRQQVRDQIEAARQQARNAQAQAARAQGSNAAAQGVPVVFAPPAPPSAVPTEAMWLGIAFFAMVVLIVVGLPVARAIARYFDRRSAAPALGSGVADQLQRIEQAVDAMSIEVERISEAQRYMARLESERHTEPAALKK
jgi:hypothetical protein